MRLHRFFIDTSWTEGPVRVENHDLCHQWASVLRMTAGDRLIICDGQGMQAEAMIEALTSKSAVLRAESPSIVSAEPKRRITLACAVLKRENFELVVQKATEAGAARILPLLTERTVKTGLKRDRLLRIAREAAEQSGRGVIPHIAEPVTFDVFLSLKKRGIGAGKALTTQPPLHSGGEEGARILQKTELALSRSKGSLLHQNGEGSGMRADPVIFFHCGTEGNTWVKSIAGAATCLIGPEGGWTDDEEAMALRHGCISGSLGLLTLRAETAAVIATYLAVTGC